MKKYILLCMALCLGVFSNAQDLSSAMELTKEGAVLTYELLFGKKLRGHIQVSVLEVKTADDGTTEVTTLLQPLDTKMKKMKYGAGLEDGIINVIRFKPDGSYTRKLDWTFGVLKDLTRSGFMMEIPAKLEVGQKLESGEITYAADLAGGMGRKQSGTLKYTDWVVESEEEINLPAGTIKCFKISGDINGGKWQGMNIKDHQTWWMAPGLGIVKMEANYLGKPIITQLKSTEGI